MTTKSNKPGDAATLRRQAEEKFAAKAGLPQKPDKPLSVEESQAALHELGVHQIELEMQNEELRRAQLELDTARERYFDLYDLAPVGYCTVSEEGLILESNLTMSELLGISKSVIVQSPLSRFIIKEDQDANYLHHKRLFAGDGKQDFDLRMLKTDGTVFWAHMAAVAAWDTEGTLVARVVLSDISGVIDARQRFESSFRNNPALMAISSIPEMKFLDVNAAFLTTMGYCREDVIGKTSIELDLFPDSVQQAKLGEQLQRDGHVEDCELYVRHKNGRLLTGLFSGVLINNDGQQFMLTVMLDITDRKQAEGKLRKSEERHRDIIRTSMDGYLRVDEKGFIREVNETYCSMSGYGTQELLGMHISDLNINETQEASLRRIRELMKNGESRFESRHRRKNGSPFEIEVSVQYHPSEGGYFIVFLHDITRRKQAELALSESEHRFSSFMEHLPAIVFLKDSEGHALFVNKYMDDALGASQWLGKTMFEVFPNEFGAKLLADDMNVMKSGYQRFEQSFSHLDGSLHIYDVSKFVITRPGQEPLLGGVALDITERKSAEDKQRASEEKWHRLFDISPVGISVLDDKRNITDFNSSLGKILGITGEGLRSGQYLKRKYLHRDGTPFLPAEFPSSRAIAEQTNIGPVEIGVVKEDGTVVWTEVTSAPLPDSECITITANMTERKQIALQLAESKALTDAVIENVPLMVFLKEAEDLRFVIFNRAGEELLGYDRKDLLGKNNLDLFPAEQAANFMAKDREVLDGEAGYLDIPEEPLLTAKKGQRLLHTRKVCIRGADGVTKYLLGVSEDITERKQAEQALRESEARLVAAQAVAKIGSWETDLASLQVEWSDETYRIFELDKERFKSSHPSFLDFVHADDRAMVDAALADSYDTRSHNAIQHRIVTQGGITKVVEERWVIVRDNEDRPSRALGTCQDITDRKKAEDALRLSEEKYALLVNHIPSSVSIVQNGKVVYANDQFVKLTGYSVAEVNAMDAFGVILPSDREKVLEYFHRRNSGGSVPDRYEFRLVSKDNNIRWIERQVLPLIWAGEPAVMAVDTDITKAKNAEAEQQKLREKAESSSRLAAVGEMAAGIAHEINNPLTGVIGFSELLAERQDLPADVKEDIQRISAGSARVKEIVKRMLTFSRQTKPKKSCVNINELIEATLDLRSYVLKTANIEVVKHFDPDLHCVVADAGQMQQVFLNLIVNAEYSMKQSHGRGNLTIATEKAGDRVRISFKDDGAGMTRDTREKVFNPFFTTKGVGEGTGLGLSVTRSIILEHNGTIEVESEPGKGATFTVILPINCSPENTDGDSSSDTASAMKVKSGRIIVVDDEEAITSLVKAVLTREGYRVDVASDSTGACEMLDSTLYDAVLMDIRMPGISGIDIYNDIKSRRPELAGRFVFITADASDDNTKAFLDTNELPYIVKPFDIKILLKMVDGLLLLE